MTSTEHALPAAWLQRGLTAALLLLAALFFFRFQDAVLGARAYVAMYRAAGGDYDAMRRLNSDMQTGLEAARVLPPGARYDFSSRDTWTRIRLRYALYPIARPDAKNWDYYIDTTGKFTPPADGWTKVQLSRAAIYAKPGVELKSFIPETQPYSSARPRLAWLGWTLAELAVGVLLLSNLRVDPARGGALWYLGAAYLSGFAALGGVLWIALLLGISLRVPLILGASVTLLVAGALLNPAQAGATLRALGARAAWRAALPATGLGCCALVLAAGVCVAAALPAALSPVMSWDAQSHWIYKAKALFEYRTLGFSADSHSNEYPILWPIHGAIQFVLAGGAHDEMVQWTVGLLLIVLSTQLLGGMLRLGVPRAWAWLLLPVFFACFWDESLQWAYAETALLAFFAAGLAALAPRMVQHDGEQGTLALGVFMFAAMAATKLEGGPASLIAGIALAVCAFIPPRRMDHLKLGAMLALPIVLTMGWAMYQGWHGYLPNATHLREPFSIGKIAGVCGTLLESAAGRGPGWYLFAGMAVVALLRGGAWNRGQIFLAFVALGLCCFVPAALLGWTTERIDEQSLTATPRLILHAAPALMLLFASFLKVDGEDSSGAATQVRPS